MPRKPIENWAWIFIYGGLLMLSLGWFIHLRQELLGWVLQGCGGLTTAAGAGLIVLRSRTPD